MMTLSTARCSKTGKQFDLHIRADGGSVTVSQYQLACDSCGGEHTVSFRYHSGKMHDLVIDGQSEASLAGKPAPIANSFSPPQLDLAVMAAFVVTLVGLAVFAWWYSKP